MTSPGMSQALARIDEIRRRIDSLLPPAPTDSGVFAAMLADATEKAPTQGGGALVRDDSIFMSAPPVGASGQEAVLRASIMKDASAEVADAIFDAAGKHNVDPALVAAVAKAESNFNPRARSGAGAIGIMQLMPDTARGFGVTNPYDVRQNVDAGTRYLKQLISRFDGNLRFAVAGYNAGPGAVAEYGGIPPYSETRGYVERVMRYYRMGKAAQIELNSAPGAASVNLSSFARVPSGGVGSRIAAEAKKYLGVPYVWGGNTPQQGFDCSGFTRYVFRKFGIELPRVSKDQAFTGQKISWNELRPGDLMFFARGGAESRSAVHHVGIYIGDGKMINAPARGKDVRIESIDTAYRRSEFIWGRRLV